MRGIGCIIAWLENAKSENGKKEKTSNFNSLHFRPTRRIIEKNIYLKNNHENYESTRITYELMASCILVFNAIQV